MNKVIVVDANDNVIALKPRQEITPTDLYRVSVAWIKNSQGKVLLAKRKADKLVNPGCWGPAVSGTLEESETYESNIHKELQEELGLTDCKLRMIAKIPPAERCNYFIAIYETIMDIDINKDLVLQESEVDEVAWFDLEELKEEIDTNPSTFVSSAPYWKSWGILG